MKIFSSFLFSILILSCGTPSKKKNHVIGDEVTDEKENIVKEFVLPDGAITGNFKGDNLPFYSYIKNVDTNKAITTVAFENEEFSAISIPKSYGAMLDTLKMKGMDRDLLLATVKLKDTNFNKYYLYKLQNNQWNPVVNGFAIHKSNRPDTLRPIIIDPNDSTQVIRYYSVFDLDKDSETGYRWKLLKERIPIED